MVNDKPVKILLGACVLNFNVGFVQSILSTVKGAYQSGMELVVHFEDRVLLHTAQKNIVNEARKQNCTHVLFIEDDTTFVPNDALERMLTCNEDVVGAYAYSRHFPFAPNIHMKEDRTRKWDKKPYMHVKVVESGCGFKKVDLVPFQYTLIKMRVFEKIKKPWFFYGSIGATDTWFADRCFEKGISLWCDTESIVRHGDIDEKTVGFKLWERQHMYNNGEKWNNNCSKPFLKYAGVMFNE